MNVRLRLILAFFLLSVVPLGAVTFYAYTNNVRAMREAAGRESELLAGELTQRMQLVTAQLSDRMAQLAEMGNATPAAASSSTRVVSTSAAASRARGASTTAASSPVSTAALAGVQTQDQVADALGDVAMLLNNVELHNMRGFGPPGERGRGRRGDNGAPDRSGGQGGSGGPEMANASAGPNGPPRAGGPDAEAPGSADRGNGPRRGGGRSFGDNNAFASRRGGPPPSGAPTPPSGGAEPSSDGRITIDMTPIRRAIMQHYATQEEWERMSPEERQRIASQVNQQMFGVAMGIRLGAAEAQRKVMDAQRAAGEKAREVAAQARQQMASAAAQTSAAAPSATSASSAATTPASASASAPTERRTAFSGNHLDVTLERNGQVLHQVNAEINLQNLLSTVFATTRRDRGEVPFAVATDGHLYTPNDADRARIEALGVAKPSIKPGTTVLPDWIVVTTADPTGSGLTFGIARPVGDSLSDLRRTTARNVGFGLGFIALALVGIVPLATRLTRNLLLLSDGVRRIAAGDYRARVPVRSHDEVGRLAEAFNQMAADVEEHQREAVGQERLKRELELGRQIQHDMLPQGPLKLGLAEVKGVSVPAREVGGDFFNYFPIADGQVALLVGDVSGKGVGAALLMANVQASLRTRLALGQDLAAIAGELDVEIEASTPVPVYATLFVAIFDPRSRSLRYVNAGHHPQFVVRARGGLDRMPSSGLPIGLLAGHGYTEARVDLQAGDRLFFYTDGCVEAEGPNDDMFGASRLEAVLTACGPDDDLLAMVERAVTDFRAGRDLFDDITMMAVSVG
jgi:serine phosphatase RsbU (regulator of sigma subunit)